MALRAGAISARRRRPGRSAAARPFAMSRTWAVPSLVEDDRDAGADAVGLLQLALQAAPGQVDLRREPARCEARRPGPRRGDAARRPATATKRVDARSASLGLVEGQEDPLDARGPADAGRRRARRARRSAGRSGRRRRAGTARRARRSGTRRSCACSSRAREPGCASSCTRCRPGRAARAPPRSARRPRPRAARASSARSPLPPWSPGSAASKARRGLVSMRSTTSLARVGLVGAQIGLELLAVRGPRLRRAQAARAAGPSAGTPRPVSRSLQDPISSASTSGESEPITSPPSWLNWR